MHEYLWNLNMFIRFNYEYDAHQITKNVVFYSALGVQVKIFGKSREPQLIILADDKLSISTLNNTEYITADQSRC